MYDDKKLVVTTASESQEMTQSFSRQMTTRQKRTHFISANLKINVSSDWEVKDDKKFWSLKRKFCTTSKTDRHLSRQKICQRFSVMKTNTLYSSRLSRELAFYFTFCLEVNKNTRITENL